MGRVENLRDDYAGRRVLITGGAGFVGSNLAHRLVALGARVTVVDSLVPGLGGNPFNLEGIRDSICFSRIDLRDAHHLAPVIRGQELIFNLAGQVSHVDSMRDPLLDLELNVRSHATLLEECRRHNPVARVVLASTRQVYGRPRYSPVDEEHPVQPVDTNGIHKLASERYHLLYHEVHGLPVTVLRLTNTYGPRQLIAHARQGFIAWFVRTALLGGTIDLFGGGTQVRDMTYVDDAVDALVLAGARDGAAGRVFNLGGARSSLLEIAGILRDLCPACGYRSVEFPEERRRIDIGDFVADWSKARSLLGWEPAVPLREGLARTIDYYRGCLDRYL